MRFNRKRKRLPNEKKNPTTNAKMRKVHRTLTIRRRSKKRRRRRKNWLLKMAWNTMTPKRALTATKQSTSNSDHASITRAENSCKHCENPNVYKTLILKCPKCSCHDYYKICPLCDHQIPINIKHLKEGFI